jgi:type IV pilus assembly protein PilQ
MLLCCVLASTSFQHEYTQAQSDGTESTAPEAVGRENPFEEIGSEKKRSLFERVFKAERPVAPPPELFVQTVTLKFLDAKNLKAALDNMLSGYGTIAVDAKSNSLIISDNKENLEKIIEQAREADRTPRQIVVEVVIVDVQLEDDTQIGVNWDILSDELYDISYRQNLTSRLGSTIDSAANIGNATAFNTTGTGGDFAIISGSVRNVVHLLQQKTNLEILASPKVMVVSGRKAEIRAVDEIPFNEIIQTSEGGQLSATSFKDVGVTLKVMATLTEDDEIFLQVDTEQKIETGTSDTDVPIVDARVTNTSLLLKDGQVVAIGGLRRRERTKLVDQVPFLGDLPMVGFLFRSTRIVEVNSELVVFLSPHIYNDEPLTQEQMNRFNELKDRPPLEIPRPRKKDLLPLVEILGDPNAE